jgi:hypothetical protein
VNKLWNTLAIGRRSGSILTISLQHQDRYSKDVCGAFVSPHVRMNVVPPADHAASCSPSASVAVVRVAAAKPETENEVGHP